MITIQDVLGDAGREPLSGRSETHALLLEVRSNRASGTPPAERSRAGARRRSVLDATSCRIAQRPALGRTASRLASRSRPSRTASATLPPFVTSHYMPKTSGPTVHASEILRVSVMKGDSLSWSRSASSCGARGKSPSSSGRRAAGPSPKFTRPAAARGTALRVFVCRSERAREKKPLDPALFRTGGPGLEEEDRAGRGRRPRQRHRRPGGSSFSCGTSR